MASLFVPVNIRKIPHRLTRKNVARVCAAEADVQLASGVKVRVATPVTVYHVPGTKGAPVSLEGMEGEIVADVTVYKGKTLSPNLPLKVQFERTNDNGKEVKFYVHMSDHELEAL